MLVCLQLDQEIEKRTRTLRELQKDQEKSQRDFLYSSVNQSTNTSRIHIDLKLEIVETGRRKDLIGGADVTKEEVEREEERVRERKREKERKEVEGLEEFKEIKEIKEIEEEFKVLGGRYRTFKINEIHQNSCIEMRTKMKLDEKEVMIDNFNCNDENKMKTLIETEKLKLKDDTEKEKNKGVKKKEREEGKDKSKSKNDVIRINKIKNELEIINLLKAAQKGFFSYIITVSMNNGTSWIESSENIIICQKNILSSLQFSSSPTSSSSSSLPSLYSNFNCDHNNNYLDSDFNFELSSIAEKLKLKSSNEICALSLFAPIIIPTDYLVDSPSSSGIKSTNQLVSEKNNRNKNNNYYDDYDYNNDNHNHNDNNHNNDNIRKSSSEDTINTTIRPILDIVGIKINCFKNSISAIKMFLNARVIVSNV